ncbi:serine/threonine protein kinase [Pyxidicoccus trucidator]|uniref:serine/threonine protein kinase n=1 Tax=Pyxidicoccus trucidator TaxID=2709662 RepID=UPI0013D8EBC0|nr:serine/threonine protein kinase [Pyxidicoccus trucidator]
MTLEAGTHIGKYVVRRKLAEGGMAEIYLCTARGAEGFEKEVVIKRVRAFLASDPEFVGMFIAEARLASRLNHANVVQIFDFDKHEDTYYLAMEYVRGCSLWELRKRCKELMEPVPPVMVAHIGAEVARGLHYAHRVKVNGQPLDLVHRDVTPHNVLLSFDGAVKLTDFGIAKAGNKLTQPGVLKGKFAYMSPEQARGEAVDARTDIFALGVVLWEMLTGGRLFDGDSEVAVLRAVQQSTIPPPARLNPDVPADLDAAVVRALDRDPAVRFQTAGELERALAQCVLKHAKTVDDTDLSAFMRRLFPTSLTQAMPTVQERTHVENAPVPPGSDAPVVARREPTAVMPGVSSGRGVAMAPSPDEDLNAPTFVLPRRDEAAVESVPLPPMATPMMPLPAVASSPVPRASVLPPLAAPIAAVRPSRPEGTPSVAPAGVGEGSGPGPSSGRRPSQPEGMSSVSSAGESGGTNVPSGSSPATPASRSLVPAGESGGTNVPSDTASSAQRGAALADESGGTNIPSANMGAPSSQRGTASSGSAGTGASAGPRGPESASVEPAERSELSKTESVSAGGRDAQGTGKPAAGRNPLSLGLAAALGLAVVGGGVAVMRARADSASTDTAQVSTLEGAGTSRSPAPGEAGPSAPVAAQAPRPAAPTPSGTRDEAPPGGAGASAPSGTDTVKAGEATPPPASGSAPAATGSAGAAVAASGDEPSGSDTAEVDGLKREEVLGAEPRPVSGDSRPAAVAAQDVKAAASTGMLQVRASPYATVFLNGKKLGEVTGRASYKLAPGTYRLVFQHPSGAKQFDVTIAAGTSVTREFRATKGH